MLGSGTVWRPILVGALHKHYRRVSWGATPALRSTGVVEIEARAAEYGLPPLVWHRPAPSQQPHGDARRDVGCATRPDPRLCADRFRDGVRRRDRSEFSAGSAEAAKRAGLDAGELALALDDAELKQVLRSATDEAIARGVYGVPTFDAAGLLWWGDHQLAAAAAYPRQV